MLKSGQTKFHIQPGRAKLEIPAHADFKNIVCIAFMIHTLLHIKVFNYNIIITVGSMLSIAVCIFKLNSFFACYFVCINHIQSCTKEH